MPPVPVTLTLIACFSFALENVLIERFFKNVHPFLLVCILSGITSLVTGILALIMRSQGTVLNPPATPKQYALAAVTGLTLVCGEVLYIAAFYKGGTASTITPVAITLPLFAMIIVSIWSWQLPDWRAPVGLAFIAIGVWVISQIPVPGHS